MFCGAFVGRCLCNTLHKLFHRPHKIQLCLDRRQIDDAMAFCDRVICVALACHMVVSNLETLETLNRSSSDN